MTEQKSLPRAGTVLRAGEWNGPTVDHVVLDFDARHRRRTLMTGEGGLAFLLDLAEATVLLDGDALVLEDGRRVAVRAAEEPLLEITAPPPLLLRLAWHLGNRHLPTELGAGWMRIRYDHVIADMIRGLGGYETQVRAPFNPEGGAYAGGHHHHHDHGEGHAHSHG